MNLRSIGDVQELMKAPQQAAALSAALQLGLFWLLEGGPRSSADIAKEMKIPPKRCNYWLQLLATMNLLERDGDRFNVSPLTRAAILNVHSRETWKMLAIDAEDELEETLFLADRLSDPGPKKDSAGRYAYELDPYVQKMAGDPDRARMFTRMLYDLHARLAQEVAETLEVNGARSLLDVGGGSGVVSLALLRRHPGLKAVVVDIDHVCEAGREIAGELPEGDRISYLAANFVEDELPKGFDIVIECDVAIFDDAVLANLAASLNGGGRLVIVDRWFDLGEEETAGRLAHLLSKSLRDPGYSLRSVGDIRESLAKTGLAVESVVELKYGAWKMIVARG